MKPKVAFICVHNSCRSQMAEALGNKFASEVFESYSAGTETKPQINQDAVRIINDLYTVDMNITHKSKLIEDIPEADIVIKMGCNVVCPIVAHKYQEDWGLDDPTGKSDEEFIKTANIIKEKVMDLKKRIQNNEIDLKKEISW
jgi:arsenate reductase